MMENNTDNCVRLSKSYLFYHEPKKNNPKQCIYGLHSSSKEETECNCLKTSKCELCKRNEIELCYYISNGGDHWHLCKKCEFNFLLIALGEGY